MQQLHWHILFLSFTEKVCYHFEGFGKGPDLIVAFTTQCEALGWKLISIPLHVQWDGSSCGVWVVVARDAYLAYIESPDYGKSVFAEFFEQWLARHGVVRDRIVTYRSRGKIPY